MTAASDRTCKTCACSHVIEPPKIATPDCPNPAALPPQRVCRLNPPFIVQRVQQVRGPKGVESVTVQGLSQQPVMDDTVCWQWKAPGTRPGHQTPWTPRLAVSNDDVPLT